MASIDQVISQIRFGLEQLSSKNAHHEFEHLCRHLVRTRICSNILPATGPVAAGGDQGRDFETFRTYLNSTSIASSTFVGLASIKPLAFACSLEDKKSINRKIKSDVNTIMASGSPIEGIHYFASADIVVATRHNLQDWAQTTHQVSLVLHDGNAIAELLGDPEVFWISERFLNIPAEIFPRVSSDEKKDSPKTIYFPETPIGRQDILEALQSAYDSGKRKFLIHGLGGVGKTRIGLEFAKRYRESYPAQCLVDMQGLSESSVSAESAMLQIVRQFDRPSKFESSDIAQIVSTYRDLVQRSPTMIILDNAENLESVELVCQVNDVFIVITSRDAFGRTWEGDNGEKFALEVNQMSEPDAEALLFSIAGEERFEGRAGELAKLAGYLPMGLKVLAGILKVDALRVETASSLIAKYQDAQKLLQEKVPDYKHLPYKDRENLRIEASFELSYKKLTDDQRLYWRWLSISPSDFDLETLRHILGVSMDEANQIQMNLRNQSLLEYNDVTNRFKFHDLARAFANSRLDEDSSDYLKKQFFLRRWALSFQFWLFPEYLPEERLEASYRHADHYASVFETAYQLKYSDPENGFMSALDLLDKEWPNIVAGQRWAAEHFQMDPKYADTCCRYSSFSEFFDFRLTLQESIAWQETSIRAAKKFKNRKRVGLYSGNLGIAYRQLGNFEKAAECHSLSLAIAQEFNDEDSIASAIANLATVYTSSGKDHQKALELLETVLRMARATKNKRRECLALGTLGNVYSSMGDFDKAIDLQNQSLRIAREIGELHGQSIALGNLATAYHEMGESNKAREYDEQSLQMAQLIGDKFGADLVLRNMIPPRTFSSLEEFEEFIKSSEELLKNSRENGDYLEEFNCLFQVGQVYSDQGQPSKAIDYLNLALNKTRQLGDKGKELACLSHLATVFGMLGNDNRAIEICQEALRISRETGNKLHEGIQLQMLGLGYAGLGDKKKACTHWKQALEVFETIKSAKAQNVSRLLREMGCK